MQNSMRPRRRLPARVYWVRRGLVLGTAFLLVFAVARLLGGGSDGDPEPQGTAAIVNGEPTPTAGAKAATSRKPSATPSRKPAAKPTKPSAKPKATPSGPCNPADLTVRPTVERQAADGRIEIPLEISGKQAACTWQVSNESMVIRISSGQDGIWSSQECPKIPSKDIVVRSAEPAVVTFVWNGRRSDDNCSRTSKWALPGYYHVTAAALGGEPADQQFELLAPKPKTVYKTITPSPTPEEREGG